MVSVIMNSEISVNWQKTNTVKCRKKGLIFCTSCNSFLQSPCVKGALTFCLPDDTCCVHNNTQCAVYAQLCLSFDYAWLVLMLSLLW